MLRILDENKEPRASKQLNLLLKTWSTNTSIIQLSGHLYSLGAYHYFSTRNNYPGQIDQIPAHQCSVNLRLDILTGLPFISELSPGEIQQINTLFVEKGYDQGEFFGGLPHQPGQEI